MTVLTTRCVPFLFFALATATNATNATTSNTTSTSSDTSSGLQTWEIALVAGVGGLALILCMFACCLIYRRRRSSNKEVDGKDVEAAVVTATETPVVKSAVAPAAVSAGLPAATKGPVGAAEQVAVSTGTKIKEAVSGNQGCPGPSGKKFPARWGEPPETATRPDGTCVTLPDGYGSGPRKLKVWIENQIMTDMKAKCNMYPKQQKCFPESWSTKARKAKFPKPTVPKTYKTARAPNGYGEVPEVLVSWITLNIDEDDKERKAGGRSASVELVRPGAADRNEDKAALKRIGSKANA